MSTPYPYKRPGVYVSETLLPLPAPAVAPGVSTAAFVGTHNAGPSTPTLISSWAQWVSLYGGFGTGLDYLPFQVYQFFANGGAKCWVLRATSSDAVAASATVNNVPIPPVPTLTASPAGTAPTGAGTAPVTAVGAVTLSTVSLPLVNPEQSGFQIQWAAVGSPLTLVDAYQVVCTPNSGTGAPQTVWVTQPVSAGNVTATFEGLQAGVVHTVQITPYKGTAAGPVISVPPTFSTVAPFTPVPALKVTSLGVGKYGNSVFVDLVQSWNPGKFHLFVKYGSTAPGSLVESWQDVSLNPADPRYVVGVVNSSAAGSSYISVANLLPPVSSTPGTGATPDASWFPVLSTGVQLASGADGVAAISLGSALTASFATISDVLLLNLCGTTALTGGIPSQTTVVAAMNWVASRGRAFLVLDAPATPAPADSVAATAAYNLLLPSATPPGSYQPATSYAAMYGPWIQVSDPAGASVSSTRMLAPGGSMLGQFSRADARTGPNQAPAGPGYPLVGVVGMEHLFTNDQLDTLNVAGMNVIRPVPQAGFVPMGVRTIKAGQPDRYIPVRRMLIYVEDLLTQATRFAIFRPNTPLLWQSISAVTSQLLSTLMMNGQLQGSTPDQAFFVVCDATNNTPATVANGEVHLTVGVAVSTPGEFLVIQISQYQGGVSSVSTQLPAQ